MKSTFSRLQFRPRQCGSIFIRLAIAASQICEIMQNSEKFRTCRTSRSSKVIDVNQKCIWNLLDRWTDM